jgi:hypothetical protein
MIYFPAEPGVHHYCLQSDENGCATCKGPGGIFVPGSSGFYTQLGNLPGDLPLLNVWPNPTGGVFQITLKYEPGQAIEIYTLSGRLVKRQLPWTSEASVDLHDQSNGVYIIKLSHLNRAPIYSKIVKE